MGLSINEHTHVADSATGKRHGRVRQVIRPSKAAKAACLRDGVEEPPTVYVVEWADKATSEHPDAELCARFTSQSKDWKPEKYGREI